MDARTGTTLVATAGYGISTRLMGRDARFCFSKKQGIAMDIEKGEPFVVTRGVKLNEVPSSVFGLLWNQTQTSSEESYDRSYSGCVFRAAEVCGNMVAAEWIGGRPLYGGRRTITFNTEEVELWPVTEAFAEVMSKENVVQS